MKFESLNEVVINHCVQRKLSFNNQGSRPLNSIHRMGTEKGRNQTKTNVYGTIKMLKKAQERDKQKKTKNSMNIGSEQERESATTSTVKKMMEQI